MNSVRSRSAGISSSTVPVSNRRAAGGAIAGGEFFQVPTPTAPKTGTVAAQDIHFRESFMLRSLHEARLGSPPFGSANVQPLHESVARTYPRDE